MPFWEGQPSLTLLQWFLRTVTLIIFMLFVTKLMGQREIGRLTLVDFVVAVTIGSVLGSTLTSSNTNLAGSLIVIATLGGFELITSLIGLKSQRFKRMVEEEPIILIQNGILLESTLERTRINIDDLMSQIRQKGYFYLDQIEFAVLEPNGKVSVLPKSQNRPVTPMDLKISTEYEGYPSVIIVDGSVRADNMQRLNLSENWLKEQLAAKNISSPKEVLLAVLDTKGKLYLSLKNLASERLSSKKNKLA